MAQQGAQDGTLRVGLRRLLLVGAPPPATRSLPLQSSGAASPLFR
jgi:hypothetical protein